MNLDNYKTKFEEYLLEQIPSKEPQKLYEPIRYILQNGGKRIRALLVILSADSFGFEMNKAFPAAASIEIFHNFTLLHDDIMDQADVRRGKATVHKKWDENAAILSGDTMLILAYKMLEKYSPDKFKRLNSLFNKTAIEVCEGQQMDMDFKERPYVSVEEYLEMIRLKTAVLLGASLKFGGIVAQAKENDLKLFYDFGENLGMAFQIQDDYLDTYGDAQNFGKKIGGDIKDRKKTILFLESLNAASQEDQQKLLGLYQKPGNENIYPEVLEIYNKYMVPEKAQKLIKKYTEKAIQSVEDSSIGENHKNLWKKFAFDLMHRKK